MSTEAYTQASEWLVRLKSDNVSPAEVSAWLDWCNAGPGNLEAFERAQSLYDRLRSVDESTRDGLLALAQPANKAPRAHARRSYAWLGAIAASLVAASGLLIWKPAPIFERASEHGEYRAAHGAQRELLLADRTKVTLGSASTVASAFTESTRMVELRDGEAFFEVKPDRTRPFVVRAGTVSVTAIGTAFNVRRTGSRTVVSVTEGAVDVLPHAAQASNAGHKSPVAPVRLQAGQQSVYETNWPGVMVTSVEPNVAAAWLSGRREYMLEPLGTVIDDVNRYARQPIVIDDPALRDLVFTGTVFQQQIDEWVLALDQIFPMRAVPQSDGRIVLEPRAIEQSSPSRGR